MRGLFLQVLAMSVIVSLLLAVLLFPARRWLERRYAPQVRWSLWRGFALVLVLGIGWFAASRALPAAVVLRVPDHTVTLPFSQEEVKTEEVKAAGSGRKQAPVSAGVSSVFGELAAEKFSDMGADKRAPAVGTVSGVDASDSAGGPAAEPAANGTPTAASVQSGAKGMRVSVFALLSMVWLAVALFLMAGQWVRYALVRRKLFRASAPSELAEHLYDAGDARVQFRILPDLASPMTLGWIRPVVLLAREEEAPMAVLHELTHVRRRDIFYKHVIFAACALYWFDPLVWLMAKAADIDMEAACDADVVRSCSPEEKRSYGELLISAATGSALPLATRFGDGREQMKFRLTQLMRPGKTSRTLVCVLLAIVMTGATLAACVGNVEESAKLSPEGQTGKVHPLAATDGLRQPQGGDGKQQPQGEAVKPQEQTADARVDEEARKAFGQVLKRMREEHILPDGSDADLAAYAVMSENRFAVADVDADGREELVVIYTTVCVAGERGWVIGYDGTKQETYIQFEEYPSFEFYPNGTIKALSSHNQTYGEPWPFTLYQYLPERDSYEAVGGVSALSRSIAKQFEMSYPDEIDVSHSGDVYYIGENPYAGGTPVDAAEYRAWLMQYTGGAETVGLDYLWLTAQNVANFTGEEIPESIARGGDGMLIPTKELQAEYGIDHYYWGFAFDEVTQDGQDWYRLTHEDGEVTLRVNGLETLLIAERKRGASLHRITADILRFLPSPLGSEHTDFCLADVTGDGEKDLVYMATTGGTGAYAVDCCVLDFETFETYRVSDYSGGAFIPALLSSVELKGVELREEIYDDWTDRYALCGVRLSGGEWQGVKVNLPESVTMETCDFSIDTSHSGWFDLSVVGDKLLAKAASNIRSAQYGDYAFSLRCELRLDQESGTFLPDPDSLMLEVDRHTELPEGWNLC